MMYFFVAIDERGNDDKAGQIEDAASFNDATALAMVQAEKAIGHDQFRLMCLVEAPMHDMTRNAAAAMLIGGLRHAEVFQARRAGG